MYGELVIGFSRRKLFWDNTEELYHHKYYIDKKNSFLLLDKDWYPKLKEWIELRHNFVHDINFKHRITPGAIQESDTNIVEFVNIVESYMEDMLKNK